MANIKSQIKRNRQNEERRLKNRAARSVLKTHSRRVRESIASGDREAAEAALQRAARAYDKAVTKGALHRNNAANHKSRLAKAVQSIGQ